MSLATTPAVSFGVGHVPVVLEGQDQGQLQAVRDLWAELFVESATTLTGPSVRVSLATTPPHAPSEGEEVYAKNALQVLRTPGGFFLGCGASSLKVRPRLGRAECHLGRDFGARSLYEQREFFMLGLLMLLRPQGLYGLHACGLRREKVGLLLVGSSGVGKTTTTLNLMRGGWACLSDDAVLLRRDGGPEALAFRRGFSCTPGTVRALNLVSQQDEMERAFGDPEGKYYLPGPDCGEFVSECCPSLLLFPRRHDGPTRLEPMSRAKALVGLCRHSAGIMTDRDVSRGQLELLKTLASSAKSFALALGPDALDNPGLIGRLIEEAG